MVAVKKAFHKKNFWYLLGLLAVLFCCFGVYWYTTGVTISQYNAERDRDSIIAIFNEDRYLLTSTPDYSVEYMLDTKSISPDTLTKGILQIYSLRKFGKTIGFTAFYLKRADLGFILFVSVDKQERNKGYGKKLTQFALDSLKQQGARQINLVTRTTNYSGQRVYDQVGFTKMLEYDGYVYYAYNI